MREDRWKDVQGLVKEKFEVLHEAQEDLPDDQPGTVEVIEFVGPLGKMRLEWISQPLILDKKVLGSKRIGSESTIEYTYSDTEKVHKFRALKWDEGADDWVEMEMEKPGFFM